MQADWYLHTCTTKCRAMKHYAVSDVQLPTCGTCGALPSSGTGAGTGDVIALSSVLTQTRRIAASTKHASSTGCGRRKRHKHLFMSALLNIFRDLVINCTSNIVFHPLWFAHTIRCYRLPQQAANMTKVYLIKVSVCVYRISMIHTNTQRMVSCGQCTTTALTSQLSSQAYYCTQQDYLRLSQSVPSKPVLQLHVPSTALHVPFLQPQVLLQPTPYVPVGQADVHKGVETYTHIYFD